MAKHNRLYEKDGAKIRAWRELLGVTQSQLAEQLGVTLNTVWRWEVGEVPISPPAEKLLKKLLDK